MTRRIAILGGGLGGLVTALDLTDPRRTDPVEVTVYQLGWRLGGKAASGVNPDAWGRVEEHGLHVWFGFYANAFARMRQVYDELGRGPDEPIPRLEDCFEPMHDHTFFEQVDGAWAPWSLHFRGDGAVPGSRGDGKVPLVPGPRALLRRMADWTRLVLSHHPRLRSLAPVRPPRGHDSGDGTLWGALIQRGSATMPRVQRMAWARSIDGARAAVRRAFRDDPDIGSRRLVDLLDLQLTGMRGMLVDDVARRGFAALDDEDLRAWLRRHGASDDTVDSTLIRTLYDIFFAYEGGDWSRPSVAAGCALRGLLRTLFGYQGAVVWRMTAGMGDAIIAPIYEVLRRRGVRFAFFHQVTALRLAEGSSELAAVELVRQAAPKSGRYQPLVRVGGLPCWPDRPDLSQLADGDELATIDLEDPAQRSPHATSVRLEVGRDVDDVVLAIPVGAHPTICAELIEALPAWRRMVDGLATVRTQACQLWFTVEGEALGPHPSGMMASYVQPFSSWSDFRQVLVHENWPEGTARHLAYSCGTMADDAQPDSVRDTLVAWLDQHAETLWPEARDGDGFDYTLLADPRGRDGVERLEAQYVRSNVRPSERYVQSLPGHQHLRLAPDGSGVAHLVLAGDWTDNGFNLGCVEATVMSGLLAGRALLGRLEPIVGFD